MSEFLINLTAKRYWVFVIAALIAYVPLTHAKVRPWVAAAMNLLFIKLYLTTNQWVCVVAALLAFFLILQCVAIQPRIRGVACAILVLVTAALFVLHKFPALWFVDPDHKVLGVLAMLGFSYVTLRSFDMLRGIYESRFPLPTLPELTNYLLPFHMLAAGPIQSYSDFQLQPAVPEELTSVAALRAVERIAFGMFKKYVLAMMLQRTFLTGFTTSGWYLLWEVQIFYIWLYLDFSALSDIAIGVGILLGIATPENFNRPYVARNMIDFWERWHISLSQFIRRNIFIPIQVSLMRKTQGRRPLLCASCAFTIAFVLCGLWHQGTLRYLLWGALHASGLLVTNLYRAQLTKYLGPAGVKAYLANFWIRLAATALTFEFVAFSLAFVDIPLTVFFPIGTPVHP